MKNLFIISVFLFYSFGFTSAHAETVKPKETNIMAIGEADVLSRQLAGCWNGFPNSGHYVVNLSIDVNPDRTVQNVSVLDNSNSDNDPAYRAFVDAAIRAVHDPKCSPLKLPPEKYEQWKHIELSFDPSIAP